MPVITTLNFCGRTNEALDFYSRALDAETLFLMRFRESPMRAHFESGLEDLIFHATFRVEGTEFMASDVGFSKEIPTTKFSGFSLALTLTAVERAQRFFEALIQDGTVVIPLSKSTFTSWYGIVEDRFGVSWKINVQTQNG